MLNWKSIFCLVDKLKYKALKVNKRVNLFIYLFLRGQTSGIKTHLILNPSEKHKLLLQH